MLSSLFKLVPAQPPASLKLHSHFTLRLLRRAAYLCLALSVSHCILVAQTSTGTLIAVNQDDADVSIVDAQAAKEVARVPEGAVAGRCV